MSRGLRVQRVEILGEALPVPVRGPRAGRGRECPRRLPSARSACSRSAGSAGREADAAIAHHRRGDAVPGRRREVAVPDRLAVVMGVDVDEAGRDELAARVDLLAPASGDLADAAMRPSSIATSASKGAAPVPSTTVPPRITRSAMACVPFPSCGEPRRRAGRGARSIGRRSVPPGCGAAGTPSDGEAGADLAHHRRRAAQDEQPAGRAAPRTAPRHDDRV